MINLNPQRGFTLVELVMVIVIMGVIGGMVSVFMKSPIDAYFASARRAALTDTADTTVRRMARDIQRALPNSLRTSGSQCLEFIPTKTGGRYRADDTAAGLSFTSADDTSFNMLGDNGALPSDQQIVNQDMIVVYNLGITGANAYDQTNTAAVNGTPTVALGPPETSITITSSQPLTSPTFPLASGSNRFQVVPANELVVSYVCSGTSLRRTASSSFSATALCPVSGPIMASNVDCTKTTFNYSGSDLQRNALVSMVLAVTDSGESVTLQHEVHVSNTP
jgi:MSHA biogenesis protein MshO